MARAESGNVCVTRAQSRGPARSSGEFPESPDVSELSRWRRCEVGGGGGQRMQEGHLCSVTFGAVLGELPLPGSAGG